MGKFYVYEHWRPDRDECFYVGKGHSKRAYLMSRNRRHMNIQRKLKKLGIEVEVRIVERGLNEDQAFLLEKERIALWKRVQGIKLTNKTDGGEGLSGMVHSRKARAKIGAALIGNKRLLGHRNNHETRAKMSASHMGKTHSQEVCAKIGAANRKRVISEKTRAKIGVANSKRIVSEKTRAKMSASHKLYWENRKQKGA